ncbi:GNAT family N-acetyltransferase [Vibrio owensii]|uniref:GNAT family N-acetyltransferase n=1 Tax=Vibrio harveyi group TaxID=717610 RepID=UPI003CC68F90
MNIEICNEQGNLAGYTGMMTEVMSDICCAIDNTSSFDQNFLTEFFMVAEDQFSSIAFLEKIEVKRDFRGQGFGTDMLKAFNEKSQSAQVRFLLARVDNPQAEGFNLLKFYGKHGYYPVRYSNGDMLMVNKEHSSFFIEALG